MASHDGKWDEKSVSLDQLLAQVEFGSYHPAFFAIAELEERACDRRELDSADKTRVVYALLDVVTRPDVKGDFGVQATAEQLKKDAVRSLGNYGREGRIAFPTLLWFLRDSYPFAFPKTNNAGAVKDAVAHLVLGDEEILATIVRMAEEDEAKLGG